MEACESLLIDWKMYKINKLIATSISTFTHKNKSAAFGQSLRSKIFVKSCKHELETHRLTHRATKQTDRIMFAPLPICNIICDMSWRFA